MKVTRNTALVLTVVVLGTAAFVYLTRAADPVASETISEKSGAPLAEVKVPASFSNEAATGQTLYTAVCASCHGANAAGQDGVAPPLVHPLYVPSHHGDAAFVVAARNGARQHHWSFGNMPPLEQRLTDAELNAIILYIRELQRENGIF